MSKRTTRFTSAPRLTRRRRSAERSVRPGAYSIRQTKPIIQNPRNEICAKITHTVFPEVIRDRTQTRNLTSGTDTNTRIGTNGPWILTLQCFLVLVTEFTQITSNGGQKQSSTVCANSDSGNQTMSLPPHFAKIQRSCQKKSSDTAPQNSEPRLCHNLVSPFNVSETQTSCLEIDM